jgi:histidinol dehydrogenase
MKIFDKTTEFESFWNRVNSDDNKELYDYVRRIIEDVRKRGNSAVKEYSRKFDGIAPESMRVSKKALESARKALSPEMNGILLQASDNIRNYHLLQKPESWRKKLPGGISLGQKFSPIDSAGVYVPGGRAVYPSTMLMNIIPAQVAGVKRIAVVTPPGKDGNVNPVVLAAAELLGIDEIYAVGGAQAIAAFAYGTESIPCVSKITGPGNKYVNAAKLQVYGDVGIDIPAGPSELIIIADDKCPPEYVAADLFAQAEHDPDVKSGLITDSESLLNRVQGIVKSQATKDDAVGLSLNKNCGFIYVENISEAIGIVNNIAPEHLEVMTSDPHSLLDNIFNAGAIFIGKYTPNAVGDYWAGPNHTLPTGGAAKFSSPLGVMDFMKFTSVTEYSLEELKKAGEYICKFAHTEKLPAHAKSIEVRYE